jgi:type II secretory ATPase GspE/PulE/Tfp pilus assembly ATPase PilB-like protein
LDEKEVKTLSESFEMDEILEMLKKNPDLGELVKAKSTWKNVSFYRPKGCEQCNNEGYHGRLGIYEVLEMDQTIGKMVTSNASADDIEKTAREKGMRTMGEDGFIKAVQGITSIEEVMRVTKE